MKNESIVWCIQNCAAYVMSEDAQVELTNITARIAELESENARLTAAHEMQGESLVVLPRWMVSNMEDKMKAQAAEIAQLTEKVRYAYVQIEALERAK